MRVRKLVIATLIIATGAAIYFIKPLVQTAALLGHGSQVYDALHVSTSEVGKEVTLTQARQAFITQVNLGHLDRDPVEAPPTPELTIVTYPSHVGDLLAYLSPDPGDQGRHPAIIWLTGGNTNSIGDVWSPQPPDNDQTAAAFREAGIVTMYPSLRGGNTNPGHIEGFYGEVDDIIAAADFLAKQPYVDPQRIYLGGHSTGGVLVLLTAESTARFRSTFAFGARAFGNDSPTFFSNVDLKSMDPNESKLRAPVLWLSSIRSPVFAIEGSNGNSVDLKLMSKASNNPEITFISVPGSDHFSVLGPATHVIAQKILGDAGPTSHISLTAAEINAALH